MRVIIFICQYIYLLPKTHKESQWLRTRWFVMWRSTLSKLKQLFSAEKTRQNDTQTISKQTDRQTVTLSDNNLAYKQSK